MYQRKYQSSPRSDRFYVKELEKIDLREIDYKNVELLRRVMSNYAKILPKKRTGAHARLQRKLASAIKRARTMALLPYVRR